MSIISPPTPSQYIKRPTKWPPLSKNFQATSTHQIAIEAMVVAAAGAASATALAQDMTRLKLPGMFHFFSFF